MLRWWKIVCIILLTYTILVGLLLPLSPGITDVTSSGVNKGSITEISVSGYNSHFLQGEKSLKAWVKGESERYCCENIKAIDDQHLSAKVSIPSSTKHYSFDLIVNDDVDGTIYFANSIHLNSALTNDTSKTPAAINACTFDVKNEKAGFRSFPNREMLIETIRNLYFHVPIWFAMITMVLISIVYSIRYLSTEQLQFDHIAEEAVRVGIMFGILGLVTGSIWAKFTWGTWWTNDTKLNGAAATMLVYFAYILLRNSMDDEMKRARIAAVYNIFAFTLMIVFLAIIPRITDSLHPGNGGNPAFSKYDLDNTMRMVFYPAVIGWVLLSVWILNIRIRIRKL